MAAKERDPHGQGSICVIHNIEGKHCRKDHLKGKLLPRKKSI
ncbi:hypothetical protein EVA_20132 [gut metagenome]|uniref:Uncharacterized protein n=1 Tax=gut metagenome TaxID=749906 RepID=J9FA25_9ZZZZ